MIAKYGENNVDGNPKATLSFTKGKDENDTSNWGPHMVKNSGLEVYHSPYVYWNGDTVVPNTENFDTIVSK